MIKYLSLFSGIGAYEEALGNVGIDYEIVNYCEIDNKISKAYSLVHNVDENLNLGDITKINLNNLPTNIDLLTHSSPCQSYSLCGTQEGGDRGSDTPSSLMWNSVEIIKKVKPTVVIWENVKNVLSKTHIHNFHTYLKDLKQIGYTNYYQLLNPLDYNSPQNRERIFVVSILNNSELKNFEFPKPIERTTALFDLLEKDVDKSYYKFTNLQKQMFTSDGNVKRYVYSDVVDKFDVGNCADISFPNGYNKANRVRKDFAPCLNCTTTMSNFVVKLSNNPFTVRKLTPKEIFKIQGFKDGYVDILLKNDYKNSSLFKMIGNSVSVPVLERIFENLYKKKG